MAELPHIGKHCSVDACNTLDFLAINCAFCTQTFCKEHYSVLKHTCVNDKCLSVEELQALQEKAGGSLQRIVCVFEGCRGREHVAIVCHFCARNFCLAHRHPPDHNCEKMPNGAASGSASGEHMPNTTAVVKQIVQARQAEASASGLAARKVKPLTPLALKVKLMKLKLKARGDQGLPQQERAHFKIRLPGGSAKPFFFSKLWTIGRCVDFVCDAEGITNNNNRLDAQRLLLSTCERQSSEDQDIPAPIDTAVAVEDLLNAGLIQETDTLFLDYYNPV